MRYKLEYSVFLCGAVVMIFELVGSRILAPYLGTSIFVWTSLIGVILGSLSFGYWFGGRMADNNPRIEVFSLIIFFSALLIAFTLFMKGMVLVPFQGLISIEFASFFSALILFAPASVLLGMISPYALKLKLENVNTAGTTAGNLYALSTVGSIFGTFFGGFLLIPHVGSERILILLALTLLLVAVAVDSKKFLKTKLIFIALFLTVLFFKNGTHLVYGKSLVADVDTKYSRVFIYKGVDSKTQRETLNMAFDPFGTQSAIFLEGEDDLVFDYTKFYRIAKHFKPEIKKSLVIGGAGYTYPRDYLKQYPNAYLDVVEIDEGVTALARRYFNLKDDPRLNIFHEDARAFLNTTRNKYDVIFGDAFHALYSIPYQLTTREATEKIFGALHDDGVAIINIISSINGVQGEFLRAEYATYKSVFPQVYLFPVRKLENARVQNIILVALKSDVSPSFESDNEEINGYLQQIWKGEVENDTPILTDDFAPVDYYVRKTL